MSTVVEAHGSTAGLAPPPGLQPAFRVLLEHLGDHLSLLTTEAAQEFSRLAAVMASWLALALLLQLSIGLGLALVLATFWYTDYRLHAMLGSVGLLLLGFACALWQLRCAGAAAGQRFAASRVQWQQDLNLIRELL